MNRESAERQRRILRILWGMAAVVVVVSSLLPPSSAAIRLLAKVPVGDKALHFSAYFVLGFLPALHERMRLAAMLIVASVGLGVGLEFCQRWFFGRFFEVADMVADGWGALAGLLIGLVVRQIFGLRQWHQNN